MNATWKELDKDGIRMALKDELRSLDAEWAAAKLSRRDAIVVQMQAIERRLMKMGKVQS